MKLEAQVITLEQAKKLRDLGFTKDSCFVRYRGENCNMIIGEKKMVLKYFYDKGIPSYTVSELMEYIGESNLMIKIIRTESGIYRIKIYSGLDEIKDAIYEEGTMAYVIGEILIYLIKIGHIKI